MGDDPAVGATVHAIERRERARRALQGYEHGPGAPVRATASAMARLGAAETVVLVEGISDQIAVETVAAARGRQLDEERVVVVPLGGAHAIRRVLAMLEEVGSTARLTGLCDARERAVFERALGDADLERHGFFVCDEDLEDELIRAVGVDGVERLVESQGDLGALRSLQNQPAWWGRDAEAQLRRWLGSGSRRKLRYARLLAAEAVRRDALPAPLEDLLAAL
jgi:hypothetical protein